LRIGTVGRPHGHGGGFVVADPTERLQLLDPGRHVTVAGRLLTVAWRKGTADRPIIGLEGADGQELRGHPIEVPRSAVGPLAPGEYLVDDLVGCDAFDGERRIGRVQDVLLLPSADVLEVEREEGEPLLIPLVGDVVRAIDPGARRIDLDAAFLDAD
jgi:16S rRNA processing protein RimM